MSKVLRSKKTFMKDIFTINIDVNVPTHALSRWKRDGYSR